VLGVLAVIRFLHLVFVIGYHLAIHLPLFQADPTEVDPTDLGAQFCGPETPPAGPDGIRMDDPQRSHSAFAEDCCGRVSKFASTREAARRQIRSPTCERDALMSPT
jgi:hypothetical protein